MPLGFRRAAALAASTVIASSFIGGCAETPTVPRTLSSESPPSLDKVRTGSSAFSLTLTAGGFNERRTDYDWSVDKHLYGNIVMEGHEMVWQPPPKEIFLPKGETNWLVYEIAAKRTGHSALASGVRGQLCLTNTASTPQSPAIQVLIEPTSAKQQEDRKADELRRLDVSDRPVLESNETHCYPFELAFDASKDVSYRLVARAITSHSKGEASTKDDEEAFASDCASAETTFIVPSSTSTGAPVDAEATLSDGMYPHVSEHWERRADMTTRGPCAEHFYLYWCSTGVQNPWNLTNDDDIIYGIDFHNSFGCGESFDLVNKAELIEGNSHVKRFGFATLHVRPAPCPDDHGCTWTDDYWKDRTHLWPDQIVLGLNNRDEAPFFDSGRNWQQTLERRTSDRDGYSALGREYITATLNRANGANMNDAVLPSYSGAAHYFSVSPEERAKTASDKRDAWTRQLKRYNAGLAGTPKCDKHKNGDEQHQSWSHS